MFVSIKSSQTLLFLSLLIASQLSCLTPKVWADKIATLENIKGEVRVFMEGKSRGRKGREGLALFPQSTIKTMTEDSHADIVFIKGGIVRMTPATEITLVQGKFSRIGIVAKIALKAGKIFNAVSKLGDGGQYEVETFSATAGVKGTVFSAEIQNENSVFMVKEGVVETQGMTGDSVDVLALKKNTVPSGQAAQDAVPMTAEEIAMFDTFDDIFDEIKTDIKDDIQESIKEDILNNLMDELD